MPKRLFRLTVLNETYVEVRNPAKVLWAGDLMYFPVPPERDVKCYMMTFDDNLGQMVFINWIGYKAGMRLAVASVPASAMVPGTRSVPLGWFRDNWDGRFLPFGSFDTTLFLQWERTEEEKG